MKGTAPPRLICYCFGHTFEDLADDRSHDGTSSILDDITENCRKGLSRCEETNPQGVCCLGSVRRALAALDAGRRGEVAAGHEGRRAMAVSAGAVATALLSSACCWLPLLLVAFGVSAAGVAGFFETYRVLLLTASGLLLATGFYLVYMRKRRCEAGEACEAPDPRLLRFNRLVLWGATVLVVVFASFPDYLWILRGDRGGGGGFVGVEAGGEEFVLDVQGMTCAACAGTIQAELQQLAGVRRTTVEYEHQRAVIQVETGASVSVGSLIQAVERAGYTATVTDDDREMP